MAGRMGRVHDLPAFIGIALLVICVPGQDTALTIRHGRPAQWFRHGGRRVSDLPRAAHAVVGALQKRPLCLALGLLFNAMTLAWLIGYVVAVARAGQFLGRPAVRRLTDVIVGIMLTAFGYRLATERT